jgi:hypothetical protein
MAAKVRGWAQETHCCLTPPPLSRISLLPPPPLRNFPRLFFGFSTFGFRLNIILCYVATSLSWVASPGRGLAFEKETEAEKKGEMEMGTGNSSGSDVGESVVFSTVRVVIVDEGDGFALRFVDGAGLR